MRRAALLSVGLVLALASEAHAVSVPELFSDVISAGGYRYDLKDDQGFQMSCIHVDAIRGDQARWGNHRYLGLYHSKVGSQFNVRLASSPDLLRWTYRSTIVENGDMPFLRRVGEADQDGWLLLSHEQWMNPGSTLPSRLGFKLFYNESELLAGNHFNSFVAPLSVGSESQLEGTPSIYSTKLTMKDGYYVVDADIGFHFNDERGVDTVAAGRLLNFGPTVETPTMTGQHRANAYDEMFIARGAIGNIGQRAPGVVAGVHINAQEANIGSMPPTIWADWRVWLYFFAPGEGDIPTAAKGSSVELLNITTHGRSTAFGNPSWHLVPCPTPATQQCMFVSYFLFSEGAASGEAGVLAFWKHVPELLPV